MDKENVADVAHKKNEKKNKRKNETKKRQLD